MHNLFLRRSLAYLIDVVALSSISALVMLAQIFIYNQFASAYSLPSWLERDENTRKLYFQVTTFIVFTAYMWIFPWCTNGLTLGKIIFRLRLNFSRPSFIQYGKRAFAYQLSYLAFGIGFLFPWFRADQRTLHDIVCNSDVIDQTRPSTLLSSENLAA